MQLPGTWYSVQLYCGTIPKYSMEWEYAGDGASTGTTGTVQPREYFSTVQRESFLKCTVTITHFGWETLTIVSGYSREIVQTPKLRSRIRLVLVESVPNKELKFSVQYDYTLTIQCFSAQQPTSNDYPQTNNVLHHHDLDWVSSLPFNDTKWFIVCCICFLRL